MGAYSDDAAGPRRGDVEASGAVEQGEAFLGKFADFSLHVAQVGQQGFGIALVKAGNLAARLADLHAGRGDVGGQCVLLALQAGAVALEGEDARNDGLTAFHQGFEPADLVIDEGDLVVLGGDLVLHATDAGVQLVDPLAQDRALCAEIDAAGLEEVGLRGEDSLHVRPRGEVLEPGAKGEFCGAVAFGDEARFGAEEAVEARLEALQGRAGRGGVKGEEFLALGDGACFAHVDLAHDAAFEVLDGLLVGLDRDLPGSEDGAFEGGEHRPGNEAAEDEGDDAPAGIEILLEEFAAPGGGGQGEISHGRHLPDAGCGYWRRRASASPWRGPPRPGRTRGCGLRR